MYRRHLNLYEAFKQKPKKLQVLTENVYGHLTYQPSIIQSQQPTSFYQRQDELLNKIKQNEIK